MINYYKSLINVAPVKNTIIKKNKKLFNDTSIVPEDEEIFQQKIAELDEKIKIERKTMNSLVGAKRKFVDSMLSKLEKRSREIIDEEQICRCKSGVEIADMGLSGSDLEASFKISYGRTVKILYFN